MRSNNLKAAHVTLAFLLSALLISLTFVVYISKPVLLRDIFTTQESIADSNSALNRFQYLCVQYIEVKQDASLLTDARKSLCSELLTEVQKTSLQSVSTTATFREGVFTLRQLFGKILLIQLKTDDSPENKRLASQLNSELKYILNDVYAQLHQSNSQHLLTQKARLFEGWTALFVTLLFISTLSSLIVAARIGGWESNRYLVYGKLAIAMVVITYAVFSFMRNTLTNTQIAQENIFNSSQVEISLQQKNVELTLPNISPSELVAGGSHEWTLINTSTQPLVFTINSGKVTNYENECLFSEKRVDTTCGALEGELGQHIGAQLALSFDGVMLPFSSFTLSDQGTEQILSDWKEFVSLSDTFSVDEKTLAVLDPGEKQNIRLDWHFADGYGNEVQSDSASFQLSITARAYTYTNSTPEQE